jgi:hypothetical protein
LATFCRNEQDPVVRDIVTFCVIPSVLHFFLTPDDQQRFFAFLPTLRPHYNTYARSLFVAPSFVRFVRSSFSPILQ